MDAQGCLSMRTISSFRRVKELTANHEADKIEFIQSALKGSKIVEGTGRIRLKLFRF